MVNCALMHTDWRTLSFYEYQALSIVWNQRHDPEFKPAQDLTDLKSFMGAQNGGD